MILPVWIWIAVGLGVVLVVALLLGLVVAASLEVMAEDISVVHDRSADANAAETPPFSREIAL